MKKKCPYCWGEVDEHDGIYVCRNCGKLSSEEKECGKCIWWRAYHGGKRETLPDDWGDCNKFCHPENADPLYTQANDKCHGEYDDKRFL